MVFRCCYQLGLLFAVCHPLCAQMFPQTFANATFRNIGEFSPEDQSSDAAPNVDSSTTWKTVPKDILLDQKRIYWDFPRDLAHGKHWIPVAALLGATGVLIGLDQFESPYFRRTTAYHGLNTALSGTNSSLIIAAVPAATLLTGYITKNSYAKSTALLMGEAIADAEITTEVLKLATRRTRPESIQIHGNFADTWVDSRTVTDGGFPSGHTIAAFSVATIVSTRYGHNHRWIPYVAYGVAGAIGFSRVTLSAHNVSDVFAGAALGFVISRFVVLGRHQHGDQVHPRRFNQGEDDTCEKFTGC
jgi:membrane-associated phospholipid phosphatase